MADGAIQRDDIIKSDALKVLPELADQLRVVNDQVTVLLNNLRKMGGEITAAKSTSDLAKNTEQLTTQEKELLKIQNQISTAIAKSDDEYIAYKKGLDAVNQATKDKINLDGQDAKNVDAKTSSLKTLDAALAKNRKAYADLKGEQARNSTAGKELLETIKKQDKASKAISDTLGDTKKHVGAYREELEGLLVVQEGAGLELEGLISKVRNLGSAFLKLLSNPIFLTFAALAAAIGVAKEAISAYFETTEEGERIQERLNATYDAFFSTTKKGFGELGKSILDTFGGEGGVSGILFTFFSAISPKLGAIFLDAKLKGDDLADFNHELTERIIKDIVVKAQADLDADQAILNSKDKLNFKDVERLSFAQKAFDIRKQQSSIETEIAKEQLEAAIKQIAIEKNTSSERIKLALKNEEIQKQVQLTSEQKRKIAEAEANVLNKQNDFLQTQRRLMSEISTIQGEITKAAIERQRAEIESNQNVNKSELEAQLKISEEKIKNNLSTQEEITKAIYDASRIREAIAVAENSKEISDANHAAEDRVRATGETNDEIIEDAVRQDATLKKQLIASETKFRSTIDAIDKQLISDLNENTARGLQKKFDNLTNGIKTAANDRINNLEKEFLSGSIKNFSAYEFERKRIQEESNRDVLIATVKFTKEELDTLALSEQQKIKLKETVSALELSITQIDAEKELAIQKKKYDLQVQLLNQFFSTAISISADFSQKKTDALDRELTEFENLQKDKLDALKSTEEIDLLIAGNNAQQKADIQKRAVQDTDKINEETARKEKQIQDQKNRILRRQAIFEKGLAVIQAGINTEVAATKAYAEGGPIAGPALAALVIALGALQVAAIVAKPIPQFYKGGTMGETGAALVGEQGMELMRTPKGEIKATPNKATLVNLEKGTKVWNHSESMRMIALAGLNSRNTIQDYEGQTLNSDILNQLTKVNDTLSHQQSSNYLYSNVYHVIQVTKRNDSLTIHRRAKLFGTWGK